MTSCLSSYVAFPRVRARMRWTWRHSLFSLSTSFIWSSLQSVINSNPEDSFPLPLPDTNAFQVPGIHQGWEIEQIPTQLVRLCCKLNRQPNRIWDAAGGGGGTVPRAVFSDTGTASHRRQLVIWSVTNTGPARRIVFRAYWIIQATDMSSPLSCDILKVWMAQDSYPAMLSRTVQAFSV